MQWSAMLTHSKKVQVGLHHLAFPCGISIMFVCSLTVQRHAISGVRLISNDKLPMSVNGCLSLCVRNAAD